MENYGNSSENKCIDHCASQSLLKKKLTNMLLSAREIPGICHSLSHKDVKYLPTVSSDGLESYILYVAVLFVCGIF